MNATVEARAPLLAWFAILLRILLGLVFLYAGIVKASASESFALALVPFTIIPEGWTDAVAMTLAVTEIIAGLLILLPRVHRLGSLVILCLALLFSGVLSWALSNNIIVSCGCFGEDTAPSAAKMQLAIARDIGIAAAALFTLTFRIPQKR